MVCFSATQYFKRVLRIDDSLDVFPVHGVGGIIGTLMTGIFSAQALGGIGYTGGMSMLSQVKVQALGVLVIGLWSAVASLVILKLLDVLLGLRVSPEAETEGLDVAEHEERGYIL